MSSKRRGLSALGRGALLGCDLELFAAELSVLVGTMRHFGESHDLFDGWTTR